MGRDGSVMKAEPRIYITGASSAGVTTLGKTLAPQLGVRQVDVDDFYWMPTDPPYRVKRLPADRVRLIAAALGTGGWVLTGSFDGWGDALIVEADLIVFVETPHALRMQRLMAREQQRYGARLLPGGDMHEAHLAFVDWAEQYEHPRPGYSGRSLARHEAWLAQQTRPVVRLAGTQTPEVLAAAVMAALHGD